SVKPVTSLALIRYYQSRRISSQIANEYLCEVDYRNNGKLYYALGFKNDAGGYELRNVYYKGSSHPKASTLFKIGSTFLSVFEGAYDFLSYLTIIANQEHISSDFLILNSTSFLNSNCH
ncbi:MAG TPA: DNA primase, partial [Niabella sp.]|nr:DNA primase [Niabella sp.]